MVVKLRDGEYSPGPPAFLPLTRQKYVVLLRSELTKREVPEIVESSNTIVLKTGLDDTCRRYNVAPAAAFQANVSVVG